MMMPGMGAAGMPPIDPAMLAGMGAPAPEMGGSGGVGAPRPVDAVLAALEAMEAERTAEDDAVLSAVLTALGAKQEPSPVEGVSEGAPFATPDMAGGGY